MNKKLFERQRDRETERQRDRETDRQRDRVTERQNGSDRLTERQNKRYKETNVKYCSHKLDFLNSTEDWNFLKD